MTRFALAVVLATGGCCAALAAQAVPTAQRIGNRTISGVVLSGANGQPLEGADVTLRATGTLDSVADTTTDAQGRFSFTNLPDGRFQLSAVRRGYVQHAFEQHGALSTAIVTGDNLDNTGIVLTLPPLASISGAVSEDSGDAVPRAQLHLFRQSPIDPEVKQRAGNTVADELGNFEFTHLAPGTYFLCATGVPWYRPMMQQRPAAGDSQPRSPLDLAYPLNCYPDSSDPAGAEPVSVKAGDRIQTNLIMHPVAAMRVVVQVPRPEQGKGFQMPMLRQSIFGTSDFIQNGVSFVENPRTAVASGDDSGGGASLTAVISGIAPGHYDFEMQGGGGSLGEPNAASARFGTIDVSTGDVSIDPSSLATLPAVTGKLAVAGGVSLPAAAIIVLLSSGGEQVGFSRIQPNGSFSMPNVPPGEYGVALRNSQGLEVTQLRTNGAGVGGATLTVGSAPINLSVIASAAAGSVSGFVERNGKPSSGIFVVLVPADPHAARAAWRTNQSDSDGSFVFERVIPGEYTAIAIEQGWTIDWRRPEVIASYLARGEAVTVQPGSHRVELKDLVEAQPLGAPASK
jgi:hypothetical protein